MGAAAAGHEKEALAGARGFIGRRSGGHVFTHDGYDARRSLECWIGAIESGVQAQRQVICQTIRAGILTPVSRFASVLCVGPFKIPLHRRRVCQRALVPTGLPFRSAQFRTTRLSRRRNQDIKPVR